MFRQLRERQQQRRARAAEASRAFASEATAIAAMATSAMVTSAQQTSQASSSGIVGSTVAQTVSQSTGVMASQAAVLTSKDVAIQQAALQEAQLQQALGQIKAEKEKMIRRRARMQRRGANIEELETMDLTNMDDDVRVVRRALLRVIEMQEHQTTILQDIQQSLAILAGRAQVAPSPSGPGAWPVPYPPFSVPPVTGVSPYVAPSSVAIVSLGMPLSGGVSPGTSFVTQSLVEAYREDQFMSEIIRRLEAKDKKTSAEFELVNGLLFLEKDGNKRLCVPNSESLLSLFLGECHDATGHFGYKKTATNLLQRFWWPTMMRDAQLYVETCQVCQRDKPRTQAPLGLLKPLIPERPGESLSMDFMDTLITSKSGMRHIFVIVDRFSKYARLVPMSETAKTEYVIRMFKENWVRDFGLPKSIVSDRDVRFTSELWKAAAAEQGTQLQMTSGNHPEANGQAEQPNRVVQHLLRHYIKPNQVDRDEKLALIASLYNNVVHSATGVSPNSLLLTFKPRLPLDFLLHEN
ncbi:hypothetical protein CBR_g52366 [Chara braunii]|uniref:Integrase catalytic domain-containing protein n=1 Tax=Chara braunii TaxID=69332 RepID=A0A388K6U0_CHABU|nr:hypothetical protein CBR_g52366 [Chara braunii]|eukprot:GBG65775.1 hypothetical protein CBR_g52366 [Chara braunii]